MGLILSSNRDWGTYKALGVVFFWGGGGGGGKRFLGRGECAGGSVVIKACTNYEPN